MNNFIKITIKQWCVLVVFSFFSLGSSATAILKTNSESYESILNAQFHDGASKNSYSQGSLFYGLGEDNSYTHEAFFTKKYKDGLSNELYTHDSHTDVISNEDALRFTLTQGKSDTANIAYQLGESSASEQFNWNWNFEVLEDSAILNFALNPTYSGSGESLLKLTNITTNIDVSFDGVEDSVMLEEGNNYLLSLSLYNWSTYDGTENYNVLFLDNAVFPVPAPNNILILLLALVALIPLRKSLN